MNTKQIIAKQDELIKMLQRFKKWVLKHTPEIEESERGKDYLSAILSRESELSILKQQGEAKEKCVCPSCGNSHDFETWIEHEFDDGSDEPNTSNRLINVKYVRCLKCDETFSGNANQSDNSDHSASPTVSKERRVRLKKNIIDACSHETFEKGEEFTVLSEENYPYYIVDRMSGEWHKDLFEILNSKSEDHE